MNSKHTYRWQEVTNSPQAHPAFKAACKRCGVEMWSYSQKTSMWADLNGPAFQAYYCGTCRSQIGYETGEITLNASGQ